MPVARCTSRPEAGYVLCTFDFTHLEGEHDALAAIEEAKRLAATAAPKSLRVISDVSNSRMTAGVIAALTDLVRHNEPYVERAAVIGLALVQRLALRQIVRVTGRDIREFKSREDALAYLREL